MKYNEEIPYWLALTHHLPRWGTEKTNRLIVSILHDNKSDLVTFFSHMNSDWKNIYSLTEKEIIDIQNAKKELPNLSFLTEDLLSQGYEIITLNSPDYPKTLKDNLKTKHSPTLLYIKGNKRILQEDSVAVVGSRNADKTSLDFTDNISRLASKEYKVVVSGFAKGVDKQALDSAIKYKGQSIIVLPQGIMTFESGFKKYYPQLVEGDVLVLSTFPAKAGWSIGLAMGRNTIIYGLAKEIYVAQSDEKGGTWSGVIDGLKKGRKIFVRFPEPDEKNANLILIDRGAIPVDFNGAVLKSTDLPDMLHSEKSVDSSLNDNNWEKIIELLKHQTLTRKQILEKLALEISDKELSEKLKTIPNIIMVKKSNKTHYIFKTDNPTLF